MDASGAIEARWTLWIRGNVSDVPAAAKAIKCLGGTLAKRKALVLEGVVRDCQQQEAWDAKLALDELGIAAEVEEHSTQALGVDPDEQADPSQPADLDEKAEAVKAMAAMLVGIPAETADDARLKAWLEAAENETDVVKLVAVAGLCDQAGCPAHLVHVLLDRVAVLQRPQPGEVRVLCEGSRELEVVLTDMEQLEASRQLAKLARKKAATEADMKAVAKRYKARIELLDEDIEQQLTIIERGIVKRSVATRDELDYGTGKVVTRRLDSMAIISERPANEEELQLRLPFPGKTPEPEAEPESEADVDDNDDDWGEDDDSQDDGEE